MLISHFRNASEKMFYNKRRLPRGKLAVFLSGIANCLEIQVKPHYTQAMSYDRDLRLRALEYAKEHGNQFLNHICLLSVY